MKWLDRLFGVKETEKTGAHRGAYQHHGGELKRKVLDYVNNAKGEFTAPQMATAIGYKSSSHSRVNGLSQYLRELEKAGVIECLTIGDRYPGQPNIWKKKVMDSPKPKKQQAPSSEPELKTKPAPMEQGIKRWRIGELEMAVAEAVRSLGGQFGVRQVGKIIGHGNINGGGIYNALKRMERNGELKLVSLGGSHCGNKWERVIKNQPKPEVVPPKAIPTPTLTSATVAVPFYYDAEFRVVAKRDKRLITLIEQKKTDALGNEKWEPAETNVRLYQQALKAVCGHILAQNGVL